jgi:hypothetical protein
VHNRKYDYLANIIMHLVDDDVGIFEELTRPFDQTRSPHVSELVGFKKPIRSRIVLTIRTAAEGLSCAIHSAI